MTQREIVLFHSVLGLRPAIREWAARLRDENHTVHTPDLYGDGTVFDDMDEAIRYRDQVGMLTLIGRANEAVADLPGALVYMGFSMGASAAEFLAARRPGAEGTILMHGALPIAAVQVDRWPSRVSVAVHHMESDDWVNGSEVEQLGSAVRDAGGAFEIFTYPGSGHLFADRESPDYDPEAAERMFGRVVEFLGRSRDGGF